MIDYSLVSGQLSITTPIHNSGYPSGQSPPHSSTPSSSTMSDWQAKAAAKRESLKNSIPKEWIIPDISPQTVPCAMAFPFDKHLSPSELEITGMSVRELLRRIANGQYKAVDVARAFAHRAAIAHQLVNCCIEFFWDIAEKQAMELDDYYAKHRKVIGPFHGLPISLKGLRFKIL